MYAQLNMPYVYTSHGSPNRLYLNMLRAFIIKLAIILDKVYIIDNSSVY